MYSYTGIKIFQKGEAEGDFLMHQLSKISDFKFHYLQNTCKQYENWKSF